jgi:branched-chain amino acid transport system permease protein
VNEGEWEQSVLSDQASFRGDLATTKAVSDIVRRSRLRVADVAPWAIAAAAFFLFPRSLGLGTEVLVSVLFVLSVDLIVGYAGIVTLGHGAFFGLGAYCAGILAVRNVGDPILGLILAAALAGAAGFASGAIILRTRGLTLLMLTFGMLLMLEEAANRAAWLTGGADGLSGMNVNPLLGIWDWDIFDQTGYCYALVVALLGFVVVRTIVMSPFGNSLRGIRENATRMEALGAPVRLRLIVTYAISAALAGAAGAVSAQAHQFVALNVLSFEFSGSALIMLILAGAGRLYGAFIGPPLYIIAAHEFAIVNPAYWELWVGVILIAVVMFGRGGILGIADNLTERLRVAAGRPMS